MLSRIVIVGAGAVGASIGGLLAQAGLPVHLLARGDHLTAIQTHGLCIRRPSGDMRIDCEASSSLTWRAGDLALLCVKSQDTKAAIASIPPGIPICCAQNGVENECLVRRSHEHVLGMLVWILAVHLKPGEVELYAGDCPGVLDLGQISGDSEFATELAGYLRLAGFSCESRPGKTGIMAWKRSKLLSNLPGLLQLSEASYPAATSRRLVEEGQLVLDRVGQVYTPLAEFRARFKHIEHVPIGDRSRPGGSLWQSRERGSSSELYFLNGYITRLGQEHGVPTPLHDRLLAELADRATLDRLSAHPGSLQ